MVKRTSTEHLIRVHQPEKPESNGGAEAPVKKKRKISPEGRARMVAATKARWAKWRKGK
jgi:hypothetical protein